MQRYFILATIALLVAVFCGCSSSQKVEAPSQENRELALQHYIAGSLLDQKGDYAKAIIEYQEALQYYRDPAIYYALAKDYSILSKHTQAIQMGLEAVKLEPNNRTYRETLAGIYFNAYDLDNAIKEYEEVVRIDSQYLDGWFSLARLFQITRPDRALEVYENILKRFGPQWDAHFQRWQIYSSLGIIEKALEELKALLEIDPANYEIKKMLGDAYLQQDSIENAFMIYNELVELYPEDIELRAAIANIYLRKKNYQLAEEQFNVVMKKDTLSVDEQLRFGQVFASFIQKDSVVVPYAIKIFENIRNKYSSDWRPYWFLGAIYSTVKNDSLALPNYFKVVELASGQPEGWIGAASILFDNNQIDSTIQLLNEAKKFIPEEYRLYFLLGLSYQRQQKQIEAATALEKAIQLNDRSIEAMSALALIYDNLQRFEESDSIYERALQLDPHNHLLLNNYGYSLADRGVQLERAYKMAKEAIEQQPNNQSYLDTYGWVLYRLKRYEEAEQYILKAVELGNPSAVILEHLGDVYFNLSQKEKAIEYWEKALKLDEKNDLLKEKINRGSL